VGGVVVALPAQRLTEQRVLVVVGGEAGRGPAVLAPLGLGVGSAAAVVVALAVDVPERRGSNRAGVSGGKGVPETVSENPLVFATRLRDLSEALA
jgi:hypothetical protein